MDKRLLKSLPTAIARYENTIADATAKLHVAKSMMESLGAIKETVSPAADDTLAATSPEPSKT